MKNIILFIIAISIIIPIKAQNKSGITAISKISAELNKKQITHSIDSWQIESIKGDNKVEFLIEAVTYSALNSTNSLNGIRITLLQYIDKANKYTIYIDDIHYSEIMVVINQMLTDYKKKVLNNRHGSMAYTTLNGIKFGFNYTEQKDEAYLSILHNQSEITCEFSSIDTFLNQFLNNINIASKHLYLPENAEKIKNVKKSNQEVKDVIINDI